MLLARHHGKAGTANKITGGLHASADAGPFTITGSSTHTKITQRKHLLFRMVGACREPPKEMHSLQRGGKEGGRKRRKERRRDRGRDRGDGRDPVSLGTQAAG